MLACWYHCLPFRRLASQGSSRHLQDLEHPHLLGADVLPAASVCSGQELPQGSENETELYHVHVLVGDKEAGTQRNVKKAPPP